IIVLSNALPVNLIILPFGLMALTVINGCGGMSSPQRTWFAMTGLLKANWGSLHKPPN
ncbi:MAG: hypothetical protein HYR93_11820, partial [Chloroflexi bacterium]|nr:hypothetical protein [Chloroflexota bacterium]